MQEISRRKPILKNRTPVETLTATIGAVMTGFDKSQASAIWARGTPRAWATSMPAGRD